MENRIMKPTSSLDYLEITAASSSVVPYGFERDRVD